MARKGIWLVGLMVIAAPALASQKPASDTINVIARKPEEVRKEAQAFVRAVGVAEEPVARWVDPICPKVLGVSPTVAERVEQKIREVAARAHARIDRSKNCRGNILVSFVTPAGPVARQIADRAPNSFKDVTPARREALYDGDAPIRWWHVAQRRTKDGMRDQGNDVPPSAKLDGPGGVQLGGDVHMQYRSSFLSTQVVRALRTATILVDVKLAEGKELDSVANFAALVGLAEIQPSAEPPANSILSLFEDGGPIELTQLDTKFLTTLYKLPLDRKAVAHRGLLVRGLVSSGEK